MPETVSTQFKKSLDQLMTILMSKEPSYVRCIKPNDIKQSREWHKRGSRYDRARRGNN